MTLINSQTLDKDLDYLQKDYNSVVDAVITFANTNYGPNSGVSANRLWTNFNADSFSRSWLELVAFIADTLYFYMDVQATQSYLQTATLRSAVRDIAKQFGFTPATASSASGDVVFTLSAAGIIPRGFKVASSSGVPFFLTNAIVAGSSGQYTGTVLQGEIKDETFTAQGLQNEEFGLIGPNVIIDKTNINTLDLTPIVMVNGNSYTLVDTFLKNNGTDTPAITDSLGEVIGGGGRVFTLEERADGKFFIRFGDGIFGRKLVVGEVVVITYRTGGGTQGNVPKGSVVNLVNTLPFVTAVSNPADFSGGADEQSIEQLRNLIPASLRTLERAVSKTDYSDILVAKFSEVQAASTSVNTTDPGIDLNIYVVPQGTGIVKVSENSLLINRLTDFIDRRKMVTTQFQILDAFGVACLISLEVFINSTTSRATVQQAIETAITAYFDLRTGGADGAGITFSEQILLKDIDNLIENIAGVERFEIKRLTYRPRIAQDVQGLVTTYTTSDVSIFPNVTESEWLVAAIGQQEEVENELIFANEKPEFFSYESTTGKLAYSFPVNLAGVAAGDLFRNGPGVKEKISIATVGDNAGKEEITEITAKADKQGQEEVTLVSTVDDVAGSLFGRYFVMYDQAGPVAVWFGDASTPQPNSGANRHIKVTLVSGDTNTQVASKLQLAVDADSEFSATVAGFQVTITHVVKKTVFPAADGSVPTGFSFVRLIEGEDPQSLGGTYFDLGNGSGTFIRVWFDTGSSVAPALGGAAALVPVVINPNDPANDVALALYAELFSLLEFANGGTYYSGNVVYVKNSNVGTRIDPVDGAKPTGFQFVVTTQGADANSLDGKWFNIYDENGGISYWFDTDNSSSPVPPSIFTRVVRINTVNNADPDTVVATKLKAAIDAGIEEQTEISCIADTVGSLNNKYFFIYSANNATEYVVYFNVAGGGIAPVVPNDSGIGNKTVVEVAIIQNETAEDVASKLQVELDALPDFVATVITPLYKVLVQNAAGGRCTNAKDAIILTAKTNFNFFITKQGSSFDTTISGNLLTVEVPVKGVCNLAEDIDTGFTITRLKQGVADNTDFVIKSVDTVNSVLYLDTGLPVNSLSPAALGGGSIRNGATIYQAYRVFKKVNAIATNLSVDSITDNNLDFSRLTGTASALGPRVLIDNEQVFIPNQWATGKYFLVDGSGNVWEIVSNTSNTLTTSATAVNDGAISSVSSGFYRIVDKLVGYQLVFNGQITNIQYNTHNTFYSVGGQFIQIGTIRDSFQISKTQANQGRFGVGLDLIGYNAATGTLKLNEAPDLQGVNTGDVLIDSSGQIFNITGVDNRALPDIKYADENKSNDLILFGSGLQSLLAQGITTTSTDVFSVVRFKMRRYGNVVGNLVCRIVGDNAGLPDLAQPIAVSKSLAANSIAELDDDVFFTFAFPPTLNAGNKYHLILGGDTAYSASFQANNTVFVNSTTYSYSPSTGVIQYDSPVSLSGVTVGNYLVDGSSSWFKVLSVDDANNRLVIDTNQSVLSTSGGNVVANDYVTLAVDDVASAFVGGEVARFDGVNWSNSVSGPNQFSVKNDAIFSISGPKSLTIKSNLTPVLGPGATTSSRYYDDNSETSFVIGLSNGLITSAIDANSLGRGTVGVVTNALVDNFVFRTSRYADDVVNLRENEIPEVSLSDVKIDLFGGVS